MTTLSMGFAVDVVLASWPTTTSLAGWTLDVDSTGISLVLGLVVLESGKATVVCSGALEEMVVGVDDS